MVLGQHRRMWLEAMRQTEQRVYGFGSLKDGYALVGIHLRKQKCCLKKGTTSESGEPINKLMDEIKEKYPYNPRKKFLQYL